MTTRTFLFVLSVFVVFFTVGISSAAPMELGLFAVLCGTWAMVDFVFIAVEKS